MDLEPLVSIFFPRRCVACGTLLPRGAVCEPCFGTIAVSRRPALAHPFFWDARGGADCGRGAAPTGAPLVGTAPRFPYLIGAAASYGTPALAALIRALKFRGIRAAAEPIADTLAAYTLPFRQRLKGYAVVPIPLSRERLRARGFNQSELVAASFARRLALPIAGNVLMRTRHARPQTEMDDIAERVANVRGCFAAAGAANRGAGGVGAEGTKGGRPAGATSGDAVRGGRFILIDDVTTTGATFLEAARALAGARAAHIVALAAAKA